MHYILKGRKRPSPCLRSLGGTLFLASPVMSYLLNGPSITGPFITSHCKVGLGYCVCLNSGSDVITRRLDCGNLGTVSKCEHWSHGCDYSSKCLERTGLSDEGCITTGDWGSVPAPPHPRLSPSALWNSHGRAQPRTFSACPHSPAFLLVGSPFSAHRMGADSRAEHSCT